MREWVATSKSKTSKSINGQAIVMIYKISFIAGQIIKSQNVTTHHRN
jgi:hypothetical protein